ncbi:MAG: RNA polymerase sigma factor [Saprospiraceae bacterium]|nr:RNA polymerase sigma factor [Saprospiraceae bacterium]
MVQNSEIVDERILSLLREGGSQADRGFRLLMESYQERLYWQVRRMVFDHEDANDVLQNCFVKIYRSHHTFEGKSKLFTWLYRIATNEAITFLNKKKQRMSTPLDAGESPMANSLRADEHFDGDAAQLKLLAAIETLPDKQRQVFNLRYFDEMSYAEMSELLGTSEGALKASFHHAAKKIEGYLVNCD